MLILINPIMAHNNTNLIDDSECRKITHDDYDIDVDFNYDYFIYDSVCLYFTPFELNKLLNNNENAHYLSVLHCNCRSLNLHTNLIAQLNNGIKSQFDIIALSETWLNDENAYITIHFPNYNFVYNNRLNRKGGGTGF